MKLRLVEKLSVCNPWELIQGEKAWELDECFRMPDSRPPLLSASLVLDSFQQLATWLILYSSEFQQTGVLLRVEQFSLLKWREIPGWLHLELNVISHNNNSIVLSGKGLIENKLITIIEGLEFSLAPLEDVQKIEEFKHLWGLLREGKSVDSSFSRVMS